MNLEESWDLVSLLMWLAIGCISCFFCCNVIQRNMVPYTLGDKSAISSVRDNTPDRYHWCVRDYLLMLMVADEYCPEPKAVDLEIAGTMKDTLVEFDSSYLVNMEGRLQRYYINNLSDIIDNDISYYDYYEERGEKGRWRFHTSP